MIANAQQLEATRGHISRLEAAVSELQRSVYPVNPDRFAMMAESYVSELRRLRSEIDDFIGVASAIERTSDFIFRLESARDLVGLAPASIVTKGIGALQRGLQKVGEFVVYRGVAERGQALLPRIAEQFELELVAANPGSFRVGLRVRPSGHLPRVSDADKEAAAGRLAAVLRIVSRGENIDAGLGDELPDINLRLQVLQALKDVAPPRQRADYAVELSGRFLGNDRIVLDRQSRKIIVKVIRATRRDASQDGIIREIDLDRRNFQVRTPASSIRCQYSPELEEQVTAALNRRVRVIGSARVAMDGTLRLLQVREITLLGA